MDVVDGSGHYQRSSNEPPASLLAIILDVNPHAWALLSGSLSLSKALSSILVFINAHLAYNYANSVAVIASYGQNARWLYPSPSSASASAVRPPNEDTPMPDVDDADTVSAEADRLRSKAASLNSTTSANKYRPFRTVEDEVFKNLRLLLSTVTEDSISSATTTAIAGALALALTYINRQNQIVAPASNSPESAAVSSSLSGAPTAALDSRILIITLSPDLARQYISLMNLVFASQRLHIPLDILKIIPPQLPPSPSTFLQQAADATKGMYMHLPSSTDSKPSLPLSHLSLLQLLLQAYLPPATSRTLLVPPSNLTVDFRAACFCHRRVVATGYVCGVCLSIFCTPPIPRPDPKTGKGEIECLTCGTKLKVDEDEKFGRKPVIMRHKKKKRRALQGRETGSEKSTPTPATPA